MTVTDTLRTCTTCHRDLPLGDYYTSRGRPYTECKTCHKARMCRRREAGTRAIWDWLESHPCVDCGEADPVVLDFDHVRGEKAGIISRMARQSNLAVVMAEVAKCEVRCANCHRRKTAETLGYYRWRTEA